jgi:hypothetical protein
MKPLYSELDFNNCKSRKLLPLECELCHNIFYSKKKDIQWSLKSLTRNYLKFCSKTCKHKYENKRKDIPCHLCKKIKEHKQREIKNNKFLFCSHSCSTKYWNINKTWGSNRSKLELWLEKQLTILYPLLEIKYNNRIVINAELDIYIPSFKLAFELNGIFHYEPIYGKEKLLSCQSNDNRKFQACLEHGIELCVMDTTSMKYFKEDKGIKFLNIITNIINNKLADDGHHACQTLSGSV